MNRLIRLSLLICLFAVFSIEAIAQTPNLVRVSGRISPGEVRVFVKDSIYEINNQYIVGGTLIIEPGTLIYFNPNSRIVDSTGGRIIADGRAQTTYTPNPGTWDPLGTAYSTSNPKGFAGYADLRYFLCNYVPGGLPTGPTTVTANTPRDVTVHPSKYNYIYNVVLDTSIINPLSTDTTYKNRYRRIVDLDIGKEPLPDVPGVPASGQVIVPFEYAILFVTSRLQSDPYDDVNLNISSWKRVGGYPVDVSPAQIKFVARDVGNYSQEWGHIIVLPGARAAFFRNCSFEGFRKDTTVDRVAIYSANLGGTAGDGTLMNNTLRKLTNGSGGAITTFSSRTWLINCSFTNNFARFRGGAIQLLQAPDGYPMTGNTPVTNPTNGGNYFANKNPNITDRDGSTSDVIEFNGVPRIDEIDEALGTIAPSCSWSRYEYLNDYERQAFDDARIALYLGRMRNLTFTNNKVMLSNFGLIPPMSLPRDITDRPANYPQEYGNGAFGGAIYISGKAGAPSTSQIEVGFGINNSIMIGGGESTFTTPDNFVLSGNKAINYQNSTQSSGARGGGIYVGSMTSLILAGNYNTNTTSVPFIEQANLGPATGGYSRGGAIYEAETYGRIQVRGGPARDLISNPTQFVGNKSADGGAMYVEGNMTKVPYNTLGSPFFYASPIIGGSDVNPVTRDFGFNIKFENNTASASGGAIYTNRNMAMNGAGGVVADQLIGYGGLYPIRFLNNTAGYGGGAIEINIKSSQGATITDDRRAVKIIRSVFEGNQVGYTADSAYFASVKGGGAVNCVNADLNIVKGAQFLTNKVKNGNGGAVAIVSPWSSARRFIVSDLDTINTSLNKMSPDLNTDMTVGTSFISNNKCFTFDTSGMWNNRYYPPDLGMLTRFVQNVCETDQSMRDSLNGTGTTQVGLGTLNPNDNLNATYWIDDNTGYAGGQNGRVIKLTSGASNWAFNQIDPLATVNDIKFPTDNSGYAVGTSGFFYKTTNAGTSWNPVTLLPPSPGNLNAVTFIGSQIGYVVTSTGGIYKTTDGWSSVCSTLVNPAPGIPLYNVYFISSSIGFVCGDNGLIMKTTDGGGTWGITGVPGITNSLNNIFFINTNTGNIVGSGGVVLRTSDGGNSWDQMVSNTTYDLVGVSFTNQSNGYAVGNFGTAIKTTNGGVEWNSVTFTTKNNLKDIYFSSSNVGFIVGDKGLLMKTTDAGASWTTRRPADERLVDVKRYHPEARLPENGIGLGGAVYVLDSITVNRVNRQDSIFFNRVRMQNNIAFTGAAVYSDNFDLKLIFNRSLITGNSIDPSNQIGATQNVVVGPVIKDGNNTYNQASKDLTGAIIYGEIQGPLPSNLFSEAANSIYDNTARFLIRLPDAPNTKGVLAGTTGYGFGGTDTLRGNYWGKTESNVNMYITNQQNNKVVQETFFVSGDNTSWLPFSYQANPADPRTQGPFESLLKFTYQPVPLKNVATDENVADPASIPEKILQSGRIYDLYDKGTDVKTADYSKRRMSPIEDFAVGIPPYMRLFNTARQPSFNKYVRRLIHDPAVAEKRDNNNVLVYPFISLLQDEWKPDPSGNLYHPLGEPLYLESIVNYDGLVERSNHDNLTKNETVFFVINESTDDYMRINLQQVSEDAPFREVFRGRVELVPDSTLRNPQTSYRRSAEGLSNLGDGNEFLQNVGTRPFAPYKEDKGTLPGRRYSTPWNAAGNNPLAYSNRNSAGQGSNGRNIGDPAFIPYMPATNVNPLGTNLETYYAGERYHSLPVNVGDQIRVVSRTVLWRDGALTAYNESMVFKVSASTQPPVFTGNVVSLQKDTVIKTMPSDKPWEFIKIVKMTDFLNKIFITEDREYPVQLGTYSNLPTAGGKGRDSIMTVTAVDSNNFYDPRSVTEFSPKLYSALTYRWSVDGNSGLYRWLLCDTVKAGYTEDFAGNTIQNPRNGAKGYLQFHGRSINPYIVPGGEWVHVEVDNYPLHYRMLDSMLAHNKRVNDKISPYDSAKVIPQDVIDKFIEVYCPYMSSPVYDVTNARFLQQDTVNFGTVITNKYDFQVFVVESNPRFFEPTDATEPVIRRLDYMNTSNDTLVVYEPSVYTCNQTDDGKLIANLTDQLRFQVDFNTDDELEDAWAVNWDFRFGKTSYGYMNLARKGSELIGIDTTVYDGVDDFGYSDGIDNDTIITQTRPRWMSNKWHFRYNKEDQASNDGTLLVDFQTNGKINIRIPKDSAMALLKPRNQINAAMNLDTVFSVVVSDGHGGVNSKILPIFINVKPTITNGDLPNAKEDFEYTLNGNAGNQQMIDTSKMVKVFDPNPGQKHTFRLIYPNDTNITTVPKDPCYPEAGVWDLTTMRTTPEWIHINPQSGLLYGKPGVKDAPRTDLVTVLVTDEGGLTDVRQLNITVDSTNHRPAMFNEPLMKCVVKGAPYSETMWVRDLDLLRGRQPGDPTETITITVSKPTSGFSVTPSTISGIFTGTPDNGVYQRSDYSRSFTIQSTSFNPPADMDGKATIEITVTDKSGATHVISYRVSISETVDFECQLLVANSIGASQMLSFGTAPRYASSGDGTDTDYPVAGHLDEEYCETECPPVPPVDVFDARWTIPTKNGILRNIFKTGKVGDTTERRYVGKIQPGGENGTTSPAYPLTLTWNKTEVPARSDRTKNPSGASWFIRDAASNGSWFNVNMNTGLGNWVKPIQVNNNGNNCEIVIAPNTIWEFVIVHDWASDVETNGAILGNKITSVAPNPVNNSAQISFELSAANKIKIDIVDALGNIVKTMVNNVEYTANQYTIQWNQVELPVGAYMVRLISGGVVSAYPIVIIK
ncbi:MAG: C-terminal target protein [Ignavibacteria bacterium]|nr:C-terminal target protein [Ignavibacteria bacterium]